MSKEQKAYTRAVVKDALSGYSRGKLSYVEAVLTILSYWRDGKLAEIQAEYALRLLGQTKGA